MKKLDWKDIGVRALKTFVQAFIPSIIIAFTTVNWAEVNKEFWIQLLLGVVAPAAAAGISAVWNTVISPICKIEESETADNGKN